MKKSLLIVCIALLFILFPFIAGILIFDIHNLFCDIRCRDGEVIKHDIPVDFRIATIIDNCEGFGCDTDIIDVFDIPKDKYDSFTQDLKEKNWSEGLLENILQYLPPEHLSRFGLTKEDHVIYLYAPVYFQDKQTVSKFTLAFVSEAKSKLFIYKSSL